MKKSLWFLLIVGGLVSLFLIVVTGSYFAHYLALNRKYEQEGKAYLAQRNYPKALKAYSALAKIHPELMAAHRGCGRAYYGMERYDDAIREFGIAIFRARLEKNKAACYASRGATYAAEKMWDAAIDDYANAIIHDPQYWYAYLLRGYAYGKTQRFTLALYDANEAIRLHKSASTYYTRGVIYGEMGQYNPAVADCRTATGLEPTSAVAWNDLGYEQYLAGQLREAEISDQKAIELSVTDMTPHFNLALCFAVQNDAAQAKNEYAVAIAKSNARHRDAALEELKKAQVQHPNTPAIREALRLFASAQPNAETKNSADRESKNDE